jgi:hypothetical protein
MKLYHWVNGSRRFESTKFFPKRHKQLTEWHGFMSQKMRINVEHDLHNLSFRQHNKYTEFYVPLTVHLEMCAW